MTKWEYRNVSVYYEDYSDEFAPAQAAIQTLFNELGEQGWELVAVTGNSNHRAYFKRPVNVQ